MGKLLCQKCGKEIAEKTQLRFVIANHEIVIEEPLCEDCVSKHFHELHASGDFASYLVRILPLARGERSLRNIISLIEQHTGLKVWPDIAAWTKWFEEEGRDEMRLRQNCRVRLYSLIRNMRLSKDEDHRRRIAGVLSTCTGEDFGTDARRWEKWMDENPHKITASLEKKLLKETAQLKDRWLIK